MALDNQINDLMFRSLRKEGYHGQLEDMTAQWLRSETSVVGVVALMRLWNTFFNVKSVPEGQHNARMSLWLRSEGHLQDNLPEQQHAYWRERALAP